MGIKMLASTKQQRKRTEGNRKRRLFLINFFLPSLNRLLSFDQWDIMRMLGCGVAQVTWLVIKR